MEEVGHDRDDSGQFRDVQRGRDSEVDGCADGRDKDRLDQHHDLARVRPDLDGNAIMELLGVPPGPVVGKAWRYLKDLRLERGPLTRDEAAAELRRWARDQGLVDS